MDKIMGFFGLILLSSLLAYIVWKQIEKYLNKHREKKDISQRFQKIKDDFESLENEQKDIIILFFDYGAHSAWGKKNKEEIDCLILSIKHLSQSISDNKDTDVFQISILEKDVIRIRNKIVTLKGGGSL